MNLSKLRIIPNLKQPILSGKVAILTFFLLFIFFASITKSDESLPQKRKKIALVLGGGGALGLAHIGVLRWFEEHHIPIDYITGTSMGAIVGGCYAAGHSGNDIQSTIQKTDWVEIFRGNPPYANLHFRRKEDRHDFPNTIELGLKHGINAPNSLTPGQGLTILLDNLLGMYNADIKFENLPTPFRCIAADLTTGDAVLLQQGPLTDALRASAAIPGIFKPVKLNDRMLVDGGIADNLPVKTAHDMGGEIIIAVPIPLPDLDNSEDLNLANILLRSISISVLQNERQSMKEADIIIHPVVGKKTGYDYAAYKEIIETGWEATEQISAQLLPLALQEPAWQTYQAEREGRCQKKFPDMQFIEIEGGSKQAQHFLTKKLTHELSKTNAIKSIDRKLAYEYGTTLYNTISRASIERNNQSGLRVKLTEKTNAPPFVYIAPIIDGSDSDQAAFSLNTRFTFLNFGNYGSELRSTLGFGNHDSASLEYYCRSKWTGLFIAPEVSFDQQQSNLYINQIKMGEYNIRHTRVGAALGYTTTRHFEIRTGYNFGNISIPPITGNPLSADNNGSFNSLSLKTVFDNQDSPMVPRHGLRVTASFQYYLNAPTTKQFPLLKVEGNYFQSINKNNIIFTSIKTGSSFGQHLPFPLQLTLGGPLQLGAFKLNEFRGDRMAYANLGYLHKIGSLPPILGGNIFLGGWYELGAIEFHGPRELHQNGTLGIVAETPLGPVYLGGSFGCDSRSKFSFILGKLF